MYSVFHSLGFIGIKLLWTLIILSFCWYLQTKCNIPLNKDVIPVSAKIRATNSNLPCDAEVIADTAVAVTLDNKSGFNPCCASLTPVLLACMLSKYSSIGNDCEALDCTVIGTKALGFLILITPPAVDVNKSSRFTCPSTAPTR